MLAASCISAPSFAADGVYGIFSLGYAESEIVDTDAESGAYKLGIGYQFHRQWYVEVGVQQLADDEGTGVMPVTQGEAEQFQSGFEGSALYAALLGKASGRMGELFYRVGVMNADIEGTSLLAGGQQCEIGSATAFTVDSGEAYTFCDFDEGIFAGVIGVGFDFVLTEQLMLRTEVEYIGGEHSFSSNAAFVGLRYNF